MSKYEIKGVPMTPSEYQRLRFVITNEEQQGFKPTKADVEELVHSDRHPSKELQQDMKRFDKEMDESYKKNKY